MANEGGEWIMKGLDWDNPYRIRSWRELINWINEVGFLPLFANARRDGYDFDAAWDDELVQRRYKAIMDICEDGGMHPGFELKPAAGFGKDGYKNFDGCMTHLQMQTYLIIRKFERRRNKYGKSYGMAVSYYQKPEELWGYDHVTSAYKEDPKVSAERIFTRAKEQFPDAADAALRRVLTCVTNTILLTNLF